MEIVFCQFLEDIFEREGLMKPLCVICWLSDLKYYDRYCTAYTANFIKHDINKPATFPEVLIKQVAARNLSCRD